jgi:ferredoxin
MYKKERYNKTFILSVLTFFLTALLLSFVQLKIDRPIILAERFIKHAGWIEIMVLALYAAVVIYKMKDESKSAKWRKITWSIFSVVFFLQLIIGLFGFEKFLMTGKLHFPIPAMILGGPIYRFDISIMPILFLSTIVLTGPAWCSHLCYFGAIDNLASDRKGKKLSKQIQHRNILKHTFLFLVIFSAILFRLFNLNILYVIILSASFGVAGIIVIILVSTRQKRMYHCIVYCPIGTIVNYLKYISPFRMYIEDNCTECMKCTKYCSYDALNRSDIQNRKPGFTCTYCGDWVSSCKPQSIRYKFFNLSSNASRNLYLVLTITLHAVFLGLARI